MLLTIPADHDAVLTLRDALDEDNDIDVVNTAMAGGCAETGLDRNGHEVLARSPDYCRHVLLLRRNADGVLGIMSTPSDEDDADMDPNQIATYETLKHTDRKEIGRRLANWMPNSVIEDVGDVVTKLAREAGTIEESREDAMATSARALAPALQALGAAARGLDDKDVARVVRTAINTIEQTLGTQETPDV